MLLKLVLLLPLIAAITSGIFYKFVSDKFAQIFNSSLLVIAALISLYLFFDIGLQNRSEVIHLFDWISSGNLSASWSLKIDSLTSIMLVVVTSVSCLVHIYSIGYMSEDKSIPRFMSYLSLFTFFMLILVTADNFLQLFVGWEGVGLASYLLIGFWYKKPSANAAAMKAFIVNRVGDFGLIAAIALIFLTFKSVKFADVFANVPCHLGDMFTIFGHQFSTITTICVLLFIGAMGKSAQIGLHTWLPDAMEGPTPVSALIHAATMVTAGVFLVARCSPIFEYSETALNMVTVVGGVTAIFAATIAVTQNDIKKVIAYSTCSQLGYMFFACGVGAYSAGIFHLTTHAFFKALLFLGAGSVIHAMHHEQDIRKMGGIFKKIPFTYGIFWVGTLAIIGFPPFAGFYSKDVILEAAYMSESHFGKFAFGLGIAAAFLTAFYSFRLLFLVFHGNTRSDHHTFDHAHEAPKTMLIPLLILAIGSVIVGFIGHDLFNMVSQQENFFRNAIFTKPENHILEEVHHAPLLVKFAPLIVGFIAIILAYIIYLAKPTLPAILAKNLKPLYNLSFNKWYFDELYEIIFVKPIKALGLNLWQFWDTRIVDGFGPNGAATLCKNFAARISKLQTGYVYNYFIAMVVGLILFTGYIIFSLNK